jgi:hypothetical protein
MLAMLHHYEELAQLREWYANFWGRGWEGRLVRAGMVQRGEVDKLLETPPACRFSATLLPRLRAYRLALEASSWSAHNLAKPPRNSRPRKGVPAWGVTQ